MIFAKSQLKEIPRSPYFIKRKVKKRLKKKSPKEISATVLASPLTLSSDEKRLI